MIITDIKPFLVDQYLLVRVYTDTDLVGNGESGLWMHHRPTAQAIEDLKSYFVGKDPRLIEHHHQVVSRHAHFTGGVISAALSGIDIALWDILGKSVGLPVYQLLGGKCRDRVRVFENIRGETYEERADSARTLVGEGFTALRMTPFFSGFEAKDSTEVISTAVEMVATVRDAIGDGIDLGLEIHRNLTPDEAITLATELKPFKLKFYEDPLPPESVEAHEYIAKHVDIPMALGERSYNIFQFKELVDKKIAAFLRPDVSVAGGFTQVKKIAAIAEPAFVQIFPHLMGSPVNNAAFTHFAAAIPNYFLMECHPHTSEQDAIVDTPYEVRNGYREVPDRPGIGVEINEDALKELPFKDREITGNFWADGGVRH